MPLEHLTNHISDPPPRESTAKESGYGHLVGGVEGGGSVPAGGGGPVGQPEAGEGLQIRRFERERAEPGPVDDPDRLGHPPRGGQGVGDGQAHVGHRQLGDGRPVRELHHPVDHRLGVHHHLDPIQLDAEQLPGLDDLEPLVHEGRAVDGDFRTHRPGRMGQGVGHRHPLQLGPGPATERPAAGGEQDPPDGLRRARLEGLVDGTVLRVDRHDLAAALGPGGGHHRAGGDQALLVGQGQALAGFQGGDGGRQPGETDDGVEHDVDLGPRRQPGQHSGVVGGTAGQELRHAELRRLIGEQGGVPCPHDVERLRPDRPGRTEDRQSDGPAVLLHVHHGRGSGWESAQDRALRRR